MASNRMEMLNTGLQLSSIPDMHRLAVKEGTPFRTAPVSLLVKSRLVTFSSFISSVITSKDSVGLCLCQREMCNFDV